MIVGTDASCAHAIMVGTHVIMRNVHAHGIASRTNEACGKPNGTEDTDGHGLSGVTGD